MRYIENGVIHKDRNYIFDNTDFDIYSQFIYFDTSAQYLDLLGQYIDETNVDFEFNGYDYSVYYLNNLSSNSESMLEYINTFQSIYDVTLDTTHETINYDLNVAILNFLDIINLYNQRVTKFDYYNFNTNNLYPFAEFIVVKIHNTDIIAYTFLNRQISKQIVNENVQYVLDYYALSSKYCYQYSTDTSDYNSLYLKLFYNKKDYETINKEGLVLANKLFVPLNGDSSILYADVIIDSTVSSLSSKYTLFDLSTDDILLVNNKYLSRVKGISDSTSFDGTRYAVNSTYSIEFLDFDSTTKLDDYMIDDTYYDMTKVLVWYYINIRTIKKLNINNQSYESSDLTNSFFRNKFYIKTVYSSGNKPTSISTTISTQNGFFKTGILPPPIQFSGVYDITSNVKFNMSTQEGSFKNIKFLLPTEAEIDKTCIGNNEKFHLIITLDSTEYVNSFLQNYHINGISIFQEASLIESMILRLEDLTSIDLNTYIVGLRSVLYDEDWYDLLDSTYLIPSDSYLIFLKPHVYNIIPHFDLNKVTFNNNLSNLMGLHFFSYNQADPDTVDWNNQSLTI